MIHPATIWRLGLIIGTVLGFLWGLIDHRHEAIRLRKIRRLPH